MFDHTYPKSLNRWLFAVLAMLAATPALADNAADLDARAAAAYNRGLDARDAGQNAAACQHFRNSEALYHNSITALMGRPMYTEELREEVKNLAAMQQSNLNGAKAKAQEVCGRPDGPALSANSSSGSSSNSSSNSWTATDQRNYDLEQIQGAAGRAMAAYKEAELLYAAKNFNGACVKARNSAAYYTFVVDQLRIKPALRSAFDNPDQILANAATAAKDRDGYFCKG